MIRYQGGSLEALQEIYAQLAQGYREPRDFVLSATVLSASAGFVIVCASSAGLPVSALSRWRRSALIDSCQVAKDGGNGILHIRSSIRCVPSIRR